MKQILLNLAISAFLRQAVLKLFGTLFNISISCRTFYGRREGMFQENSHTAFFFPENKIFLQINLKRFIKFV